MEVLLDAENKERLDLLYNEWINKDWY